MSRTEQFAKPFRVKNGRTFRLKHVNPDDTGSIKSRKHAKRWLERGVARLAQLQEKLDAQDSWALLLIFQAMDAAGKDGTIKHVMSGVNPQGCQAYAFKAPSAEELDHDFLWRMSRCLPERGRIGIFNRSYYEETSGRDDPEALGNQKLPVSSSPSGSGKSASRISSHSSGMPLATVLPSGSSFFTCREKSRSVVF